MLVLFLCCYCPLLLTQGFTVSFDNQDSTQAMIDRGILHGQGCTLTADSVAGRAALRLATTEEFCDGFVEIEKWLGQTVDLGSGGYLTFGVYVPDRSQVMSVKFNQRDTEGRFGGCGNYFNNLYGRRGEWIDVTVPLTEQYAECRTWVGEGDFLSEVSAISINPYNADRIDTAILYLSHISFSHNSPPTRRDQVNRLSPRPAVAVNNPHTITFDEPELLARQQAYRTFEATTQSIAAGKFGNQTNAIRAYGTGDNRYISWLPDIEQMTGQPVDFHQVDSLFFSYYLTPESDSFEGARLFITTGDDWEGILIAENFMTHDDFMRGSWSRHAVAIDDLDLTRVDEPGDVLSAVYELRLDLKYVDSAGPIEIWYDDFGWK